jgi:hypothetical protein
MAHYFVDPQNGIDDTNPGRGDSDGDPWKSTQFALNNITAGTSGDQINLQDTAQDQIASALDLSTYGTPGMSAPLTIRGYTTTINDGGLGIIDGSGTTGITNATTWSWVTFADLNIRNSGSNKLMQLGGITHLVRCLFEDSTGDGVDMDHDSIAYQCTFKNIGGGYKLRILSGMALYNYFKSTNSRNPTTLLQMWGQRPSMAAHNIINAAGSSNGIVAGASTSVVNNSIYQSNANNGSAIIQQGSLSFATSILNNIIEGWSIGFDNASTNGLTIYGNNRWYNVTTPESLDGPTALDLGNNTSLSASPFADPGGDDFSVDETVRALGFPSEFFQDGSSTDHDMDIGAAQRVEPVGGGGIAKLVGFGGGLVG